MFIQKPWTTLRYVMLIVAIISFVLQGITIIAQLTMDTGQMSINLFILLSWLAILSLVFIHPHYRRIIGVILVLVFATQALQSIMTLISIFSMQLPSGAILFLFYQLIHALLGMGMMGYVFFRKKMFEPVDIIFPIVLFVMMIPLFIMNVAQLMMTSWSYINHPSILMLYRLSTLAIFIQLMFYALIFMYICDIYYNYRNDTSRNKLSPIEYADLHDALKMRYTNGEISAEVYEKEKKRLLSRT